MVKMVSKVSHWLMFSLIVSAVAGSDYESVSSSLMFPAGSINGSTQCINITITDDEVLEADETFTVTLTVETTRVMEGNTMTEVVIMPDNDCEYIFKVMHF